MARVAAVGAAVLLVAFLVVTESRAAFVDTTTNAGNSFAAGTVELVDDDSGSAMVSVTGMTGGQTVERCITVTYQGSVTPSDIRLYGAVAGTGLAAYLDTTIELGTGGAFGDCTGFGASSTLFDDTLATFAATHSNWATGAAAFSAGTNPTARTFRFTFVLQDDNAAQGLTATVTFTWEAQSS